MLELNRRRAAQREPACELATHEARRRFQALGKLLEIGLALDVEGTPENHCRAEIGAQLDARDGEQANSRVVALLAQHTGDLTPDLLG